MIRKIIAFAFERKHNLFNFFLGKCAIKFVFLSAFFSKIHPYLRKSVGLIRFYVRKCVTLHRIYVRKSVM